jgi:hypothetical protein
MRPPEQYWRHAVKYEEAAKKTNSPKVWEICLCNAKRFKGLAKLSMALSKPKGRC